MMLHSIEMLFRIESAVINHYGLHVPTLSGRTRERRIAHPRHVAMYLMRKLTRASLSDIADFFRLRDHTTVLHGVRRVERHPSDDERRAVADLETGLERVIEAHEQAAAERWAEARKIMGM